MTTLPPVRVKLPRPALSDLAGKLAVVFHNGCPFLAGFDQGEAGVTG
jgi:hypothetical protein